MKSLSPRCWNFMGFLVCCLLLGVAYFVQYALGLAPCLLCMMTRFVFGALALVFLIAAIHNPRHWGLRVYAGLVCMVAGLGIALAARHLWLEHQPVHPNAACVPGLSILLQTMPLKDVFRMAITGSSDCSHMPWSFLGIGMTMWTLIFFIFFELIGLLQLFWPYSYPRRMRFRR